MSLSLKLPKNLHGGACWGGVAESPRAGERAENHNIMKNKRKEGSVALFCDPVAVVDLSARIRYSAG
jgi:hypothetical protein